MDWLWLSRFLLRTLGIKINKQQGSTYVDHDKAMAGEPAGREGGAMRSEKARPEAAFSMVEVMVAVMLLGILVISLFGAFSTGLAAVQSSRENLRATQIMMQKMEAVRLLTWPQGTNTQIATPTFTDWYDPTGVSANAGGAIYRGFVEIAAAPTNVPAAYRQNMRLVTVRVYWTNHIGVRSGGVPQSREMQTLVARYGMQNYVYQ